MEECEELDTTISDCAESTLPSNPRTLGTPRVGMRGLVFAFQGAALCIYAYVVLPSTRQAPRALKCLVHAQYLPWLLHAPHRHHQASATCHALGQTMETQECMTKVLLSDRLQPSGADRAKHPNNSSWRECKEKHHREAFPQHLG